MDCLGCLEKRLGSIESLWVSWTRSCTNTMYYYSLKFGARFCTFTSLSVVLMVIDSYAVQLQMDVRVREICEGHILRLYAMPTPRHTFIVG